MIKIIDGDIFNSDARFILHQTNTLGRMGSGVALQVKQKFPHVYKEYKKLCDSYNNKNDLLGIVQVIPIDENFIGYDTGNIFNKNKQFICNLFGQNDFGYDGKQYTSLEAIRTCFEKVRDMTFEKNNNFGAKIAIPYKIGSCRGGAKWEDVYLIIENVFKDCEVEIWRYDLG